MFLSFVCPQAKKKKGTMCHCSQLGSRGDGKSGTGYSDNFLSFYRTSLLKNPDIFSSGSNVHLGKMNISFAIIFPRVSSHGEKKWTNQGDASLQVWPFNNKKIQKEIGRDHAKTCVIVADWKISREHNLNSVTVSSLSQFLTSGDSWT